MLLLLAGGGSLAAPLPTLEVPFAPCFAGLHHPIDTMFHLQPVMFLGLFPLFAAFEGKSWAGPGQARPDGSQERGIDRRKSSVPLPKPQLN